MIVHKEINEVYVLGEIWTPYGAKAAMTLPLNDYALKNLCDGKRENWTREAVEQWLSTNSGDFSRVIDFSATCKDWPDIEWEDDENGLEFCDLAFPEPH